MGQICSNCGSTEEPKKTSAFAETDSADIPESQQSQLASSLLNAQPTTNAASNALDFNLSLQGHDHLMEPGEIDVSEEYDRQRLTQYRMEQVELARREAIVAAASQSMVPVGSQGLSHHHNNSLHRGGGINTYYDPVYAAAAAQDILRSAAITGGLDFCDDMASRAAWNVSMIGILPVPTSRDRGYLANSKEVIETLGKGRWDGVRLGSRGSGLAGCGGEHPEYYLDDLAEAFLETMVPTKSSLLGGCASIVENLP